MLLTAELFIELYKKSKRTGTKTLNKSTLDKYNLSEEKWNRYVDFIEDLDLDENGIRIVYDEFFNGKKGLN
jgi:hypothetical protein